MASMRAALLGAVLALAAARAAAGMRAISVTADGDRLLGHPLDALARLANRRSRLGLDLAAGSFVALGTITPVQWVTPPASFHIEREVSVTVE